MKIIIDKPIYIHAGRGTTRPNPTRYGDPADAFERLAALGCDKSVTVTVDYDDDRGVHTFVADPQEPDDPWWVMKKALAYVAKGFPVAKPKTTKKKVAVVVEEDDLPVGKSEAEVKPPEPDELLSQEESAQ